ncbi:MAG: PepSY domain-containing protein [Zoogloeaceae bacterium]|jgi:uncharacterized iron-regulated membrane protein|nr:PepSY domain-containing protein [Zoogloeaceae bacterium]
MRSRTIHLWSWIHRWSSLVCTLFMLLLCITGLPLIFAHEIHHLMQPERPAVAEDAQAPELAGILARALENRPGERANYLYFDDDDPIVTVATAVKGDAPWEETHYQRFDLRDGWQFELRPPREGFLYVMMRLHLDMFAGLPGTLFLGAMGLLLLVSIASGIVLYAPFMRKLPFGVLRAPRRAYWLDMHNLLGIVTVVWLGIVAFTGSITTLTKPIEMRWQATELKAMTASPPDKPGATEFVSPDTVVELMRETAPTLEVRTLAFPGTPFAGPHHIGVYLVGDSPLTSRLLTPALVDAGSGRLVDMREMPLYVQGLFVSLPLHFGDYGGMPLKILWAALDVISIVLLGSGLYLWLAKPARQQRKTKPALAGAAS